MSALLCAAPCAFQPTGQEPCGEPSTHLTYSGSPDFLTVARYWKPKCARHLAMSAGSVGIFYAGEVDVFAATPIGGRTAP